MRHDPRGLGAPDACAAAVDAPLVSRAAAFGFLLAGVAALAAYWPSLASGFVSWDDPESLLQNPSYRGLHPRNLRWMFTTFLMGHYQPLSWVTLGLDYELWGMNPRGYHLTSALLHAASTALFGLVAARLFLVARGGLAVGDATAVDLRGIVRHKTGAASGRLPLQAATADARCALVLGLASALFWGLHPLRVEAVSWVTERREVLCGLLTLLALENATRSGSLWARHCLTLAAMLSKASAITLPALLVLVDVFRQRGFERGKVAVVVLRSLRRHALTLGASVVLTIVAFEAQEAAEARIPWDWLPLSERLVLYAYQVGFYVEKTVWPSSLAPLYEGPHDWIVGAPGPGGRMSPVGELAPRAAVAGLAAMVALATAFGVRRRQPAALLLLLAYLGMLVPTGGFGQSGPQVAADRYTYQGGWALTLLVTGGGWHMWAAWAARRRWRRLATTGAAVGCLLALTMATTLQQEVWRDEWSVWRHTLRHYPDSGRANCSLGLLYASQRPPRDDRAEPHLRAGLHKLPVYSDCLDVLGEVLTRQGKLDEALGTYTRALAATPGHVSTLFRLPGLLWRLGRREEAILRARECVGAAPKSTNAHLKLAKVLAADGRTGEAIRTYEAGLAISPHDQSLLTELAWLLATHPDPAVRDGRRAVQLAQMNHAANPMDLRMCFSMAAALAEVGEFDQAQRELASIVPLAVPAVSGAIESLLEQMRRREPVRTPPQFP